MNVRKLEFAIFRGVSHQLYFFPCFQNIPGKCRPKKFWYSSFVLHSWHGCQDTYLDIHFDKFRTYLLFEGLFFGSHLK